MATVPQRACPTCGVLNNETNRICYSCLCVLNFTTEAASTTAPEVSFAGIQVSTAPPEAQRVKTSIKLVSDYPSITCTHPKPSVKAVIANLPPEFRRRTKYQRYNTLEDQIHETKDLIPFQIWADAISQTIISSLGNAKEASSEMIVAAQGGYIALGNILYRLSAVEQLPQMRALAITRKKCMENAKEEAERVLKAANDAAKGVIAGAARIKQEAEAIRLKASQELAAAPPKWLIDNRYTIKFDGVRWLVRISFDFWIHGFDYAWEGRGVGQRQFSWEAKIADPVNVSVWVPIQDPVKGTFSATSIHMDENCPDLPHISHGGACMALNAGAPKKLSGRIDVKNLAQALQDTHRRVQLNSLYTPLSSIVKNFKQFIPDVLLEAFGRGDQDVSVWGQKLRALAEKETEKIEAINATTERNYTWQA